MTRRQRGKGVATARKQRGPGIPSYTFEEAEPHIRDLLTKTEYVSLLIKRRNSVGHLATVTSIGKKAVELYTISDYLQKLGGGGDYEIYVKNPNDPSTTYFRIKLIIEGASHPPRTHGTAAEQALAGTDDFIPPPSKFERGMRPDRRIGYVQDRHRHASAPGATIASDEMAMQQVADLRAEKARLEADKRAQDEKMDALKRQTDSTVAGLREELLKLRADMAAEKHESQLEMLRGEIKAMGVQQAVAAPVAQGPDYVGLAVAMAPVISALISSKSESGNQALQLQAKGMETLMTATLQQADKETPMEKLMAQIIALGPMVAPFVQQFLSKNDPEKQAAIYDAMAANNLNSISMMAQLVESFAAATAGEEDKWWVSVIKEALGGVVTATERYMQTPGGLPGQRPALSQAQSPYTTMPVVDHVPVVDHAVAPAQAQVADAPPPLPPAMQNMLPMLPTAFQTPQWVDVLARLHAEPPLEFMSVAEVLAGHLETLLEAKMLPDALQALTVSPRAALYGVVEQLPVRQTQPEWLSQVIEAVVEMLIEDDFLSRAVVDAEMDAVHAQVAS